MQRTQLLFLIPGMIVKKSNSIVALLLLSALMIFPMTAVGNDRDLFHIFQISDAGKRDLAIDQITFLESSPPAFLSTSTRLGAYRWFSRNIVFATDGEIRGNPQKIQTISLLDNSYKLILLPKDEAVRIRSEEYISEKNNPEPRPFSGFLHINSSSQIAAQLSTSGKSIYRLANFFGLARLHEQLQQERKGIGHCHDIIGNRYSCETSANGPFSIAGETIDHYLSQCVDCNDIDRSILRMVSAHYYLRSFTKASRQKGERAFHRHRNEFSDLDINFRQLNEIYLRSLSRN